MGKNTFDFFSPSVFQSAAKASNGLYLPRSWWSRNKLGNNVVQGQLLAIYTIGGGGPRMDLRAQGIWGGHMWVRNPQRLMSQKYKQVTSAHGFCQSWMFILWGWMDVLHTNQERNSFRKKPHHSLRIHCLNLPMNGTDSQIPHRFLTAICYILTV